MISPGGYAKKFVCSGIDLSLTWYFGNNSLILHGELSSDLSDALIKVCQPSVTLRSDTRCDDKLTTSRLAGYLFPTAPNTNDIVIIYRQPLWTAKQPLRLRFCLCVIQHWMNIVKRLGLNLVIKNHRVFLSVIEMWSFGRGNRGH